MEIGLSLSGGGIRAAAFHLGVLRRLADENLLEAVSQLSTVSGGSLVAAAIFSRAKMQWPSSAAYRANLFFELRRLLTSTDLFSLRAIGWRGLCRFNHKLLTERARVLAEFLAERWGVDGAIRDLPDRPVWWINATCFETGKNWRFGKREMGDWQFGRHYDPPFRLAEAAAASAAVPYAIGALILQLPAEGWYRTDPATRRPIEKRSPPRTSVRLWDGGAYENLGLESLYKPQQGLLGCDFLICSDASGPLSDTQESPLTALAKGHLASPRLFDICSDQIRSLRTRMFMASLTNGSVSGALLRMGNSVRDVDMKAGRLRAPETYDAFQADSDVVLALTHPTDLAAISEDAFDRICRHGYEVADAILTTHSPDRFPKSFAWHAA
ncbi:MAG: patatin-like phospholipase family protein [Bradyrhizobium sp.]|nr:MAG: patatin-like phospholipase family protein [Bradyrhizobium sp.]